jgi:hypothetical protein
MRLLALGVALAAMAGPVAAQADAPAKAPRCDHGGPCTAARDIPLAALPLIEVPAPPPASELPRSGAVRDDHPGLVVERSTVQQNATLRFERDRVLGRILTLGTGRARVPATEYQTFSCPGGSYVRPLRWEILTADPTGIVRYRITDGAFDAASCKVQAVRHTDLVPAPLFGGLLFGLRIRSADGRETLRVLAPQGINTAAHAFPSEPVLSTAGFVSADLTLARGGAAAFAATVAVSEAQRWGRLLGMPWRDRISLAAHSLVVGIDFSHAVMEPAPALVAHLRSTSGGNVGAASVAAFEAPVAGR